MALVPFFCGSASYSIPQMSHLDFLLPSLSLNFENCFQHGARGSISFLFEDRICVVERTPAGGAEGSPPPGSGTSFSDDSWS
ncbi:unnamed protein product [Linum trigynum]|uniref:Uncharacterized protein n=1 Tax=Linum trigynum TaxID=586398 RepID=A0AAV2G6T5_9ROSI